MTLDNNYLTAILKSGIVCVARYKAIPTPLLYIVCSVGEIFGSFFLVVQTPDPIVVTASLSFATFSQILFLVS
jgi:hypothetical protein